MPEAVERRVLIVGRDYFFYTREIASEMQAAFGAQVTFVPITPPGMAQRVLSKVLPGLARRRLERYHRRVLLRLAGKDFDVVTFIQVHQIGDLAGEYRTAFPRARFLLYYWDSLITHDYLPHVRHFDRVFTFDPEDAAHHDKLEYLPLFYCERFRQLRGIGPASWDLSFVGIASSLRRYEQLEAFDRWARESGLSFRKLLVVSPLFFLRMLLRGRWLRAVRLRSVPPEEVFSIYASSRAVVDLPNNAQSGFTMRTFEALGAHRKLITTNEAILKEEFYTPDSVAVVSPDNPFPNPAFVRGSPAFSPAIERYSLRKWISAMLGWQLQGEGR